MKRNTLELVGFVSVIASLIFVGMEIRQNTTAVRGSTNQAISDQATELYLAMATDRNIARLTVKLYEGALREDFDPVDASNGWHCIYVGGMERTGIAFC